MYKLKKIVGLIILMQFIKIGFHCTKLGRKIIILQQTAYLVVNQITVYRFDLLFNCILVGATSDSLVIRLKDLSLDERFKA